MATASEELLIVVRTEVANAVKGLEKVKKTTFDIGNAAKKVGQAFALVGGAMLAAGIAAVKTAGEFEQEQTALNVLLGSAEKGKKLFSEIQRMSAATPFQLKDLTASAKTLKSFNIATEDIIPTMKMLGDVSMGNSEKMQSLTLAYSQVQSTGKLMGQDLLQMINAGFNPLSVIAEKTGKSIGELKDEMAKGAISAEMVTEAFESATSEGGQFFGMMEKQSQTLNGKFSTMQDAVGMAAKQFGDFLLPVAKDIVTEVTNMVNAFSDSESGLKGMGDVALAISTGFDVVKEVFKVIAETVGPVLQDAIGGIFQSLKSLTGENSNANTGFSILAGVVKTVAVGFNIAAKIVAGFVKNVINLVTTIKEIVGVMVEFGAALADIGNGEKWAKVGKQAGKAWESIKTLGSDMVTTVVDVVDTATKDIAKFNTDVATSAGNMKNAYAKRLAEINAVVAEKQQERIELLKESAEIEISENEEKNKKVVEGDKKSFEERLKAFHDYASQYVGYATDVMGSINTIMQNNTDEELYQIGKKYDAQREAIEANVSDEEERKKQLAALEKKQQAEERALKLQAFKRDKAFAIGQAVISTALAVTNALATKPFIPAGIAAGIAAGVAGAAQIAAIASETPKFKDGGSFLTNRPTMIGGALVGDNAGGVERIDVTPLSSYGRNSPGMDQPINLTIHLDSKVLYAGIFKASKNRTVLISADAVV